MSGFNVVRCGRRRRGRGRARGAFDRFRATTPSRGAPRRQPRPTGRGVGGAMVRGHEVLPGRCDPKKRSDSDSGEIDPGSCFPLKSGPCLRTDRTGPDLSHGLPHRIGDAIDDDECPPASGALWRASPAIVSENTCRNQPPTNYPIRRDDARISRGARASSPPVAANALHARMAPRPRRGGRPACRAQSTRRVVKHFRRPCLPGRSRSCRHRRSSSCRAMSRICTGVTRRCAT